MSAAIRLPLERQLSGGFVRRKFPAAADADRHVRQRGRRQRERVRVEVARVHDRDPALTTPARELHGADERRSACQTAPDEELRDRCSRLGARQPRALAIETDGVDIEPCAIQATDQLDHLSLGSPRVEAGKEDRDRNLWRELHVGTSQQGRCHAMERGGVKSVGNSGEFAPLSRSM